VALGLKMDDLRDSFRADSLPVDFSDAHPPSSLDLDSRLFVQQLRLIQLHEKNIKWACVDFYRAYAQRSRWLNDDLVATTQLTAYDDLLTEEWMRQRDWMEREAQAGEDDSDAIKKGAALYSFLQQNCRPIRANCTEPYVGRGSYHLLADLLRIGWHRDYLARLIDNRASDEESDS
jgi:hypothetical protein